MAPKWFDHWTTWAGQVEQKLGAVVVIVVAADLTGVDKAGRIIAPVLECAVVVLSHLVRKSTHQLVATGRLLQIGRRSAVVCHDRVERVARSNEPRRVTSSNVVIERHLARRRRRLADVTL